MSSKSETPLAAGQRGNGETEGEMKNCSDYNTTRAAAQSPKIGALEKLHHCEKRIQAGDDLSYVRFYLAWLRLHAVAFGRGGE